MSTGTLLSESPPAPARPGRFVDRGAVFAGYVGIGMSVVIAIAFALIIPVQSLVFVAAPLSGLLIGGYANNRSERWRPMRRMFANAAWAGVVTGLSLAVMYILIRLLFVFADTGTMPDGSTLACQTGPDCTYQRYARDPEFADDLVAAGITDGDTLAGAVISDQLNGGLLITMSTLAGALVAAGFRGVRTPPAGTRASGSTVGAGGTTDAGGASAA
ncbi:MAG: hypothetical protein KF809_02595 [Chloroflexi bacterium]|nr:hypothetical protein [Chloroflexota bacterium]